MKFDNEQAFQAMTKYIWMDVMYGMSFTCNITDDE